MDEEKVANSGNSSDSEDAGNGATPGVHLLCSGYPAHVLTTEERRKGAETTNAMKREASKSALELTRDAVSDQADRLLAAYWKAIDAGDWRAGEALQDRVYGKATQRTESADVTPEREYTRQELERLAKRHLKSVEEDAA